MKYIANRLRELRKKTGCLQQEVANYIGVSAATQSRIESNLKVDKMKIITIESDVFEELICISVLYSF